MRKLYFDVGVRIRVDNVACQLGESYVVDGVRYWHIIARATGENLPPRPHTDLEDLYSAGRLVAGDDEEFPPEHQAARRRRRAVPLSDRPDRKSVV